MDEFDKVRVEEWATRQAGILAARVRELQGFLTPLEMVQWAYGRQCLILSCLEASRPRPPESLVANQREIVAELAAAGYSLMGTQYGPKG